MDFGNIRRFIAGKVLWLYYADIINDYFTKDIFVRPGICHIPVFVRQTLFYRSVNFLFLIPVFTKQTLTFFIIYAKVTTVYMSNAMTRRSTYTTSSQREDGGENLQPGYMEVAFEQ